MEKTIHYQDRNPRNEFIKNNIGFGNIVAQFRWDKGHPNGAEIHYITDTAIIIITNERTGRQVTNLIARPHQIKRYYEFYGIKIPSNVKPIIALAYEHQQKGWNEI